MGADRECTSRCLVSSACSPGPKALCAHMAVVYAEKAELCDQLECLADSLPHHVDRMACLRLAGRLVPLMRQAHHYEEELLFPLVQAQPPGAHEATILRLKAEHLHDEYSAEEITEELLRIGHGGRIMNPEALGFMLRAFFENVRRHLASEREHLFAPVCSVPGDP